MCFRVWLFTGVSLGRGQKPPSQVLMAQRDIQNMRNQHTHQREGTCLPLRAWPPGLCVCVHVFGSGAQQQQQQHISYPVEFIFFTLRRIRRWWWWWVVGGRGGAAAASAWPAPSLRGVDYPFFLHPKSSIERGRGREDNGGGYFNLECGG